MAFHQKTETEMAELVATFYDNPYGFVMAMYPWGDQTYVDAEGNLRDNPLKDKRGPEPWQKEFLLDLGYHIKANILFKQMLMDYIVWRSAVTSGHGVGKSALVAWIIHFLMSTRQDTRGVVTANTANQLETKTWPELGKWTNLLLNRHWFTWTATRFYFRPYPDDKRLNYCVDALTVSEQNTEAFAGLHNEGRTVFALFDEASGIPKKIWEVTDGAMTDGEAFFIAFGNPTRPDGEFADCFELHKSMMAFLKAVDSREVSFTNKNAINDIITKYGKDSDEARIRVYGQFPRQAFNGFISIESVNNALQRELVHDFGAALIMAVDVARYGDDQSGIGFRQGRDARSIPMEMFKGLNTVELARKAMDRADKYRPDAIVVDGTGIGAGVVDVMRAAGYRVIEYHGGTAPTDPLVWKNRRSEMWGVCRDAIYEYLCLPEDPELTRQLTNILYTKDVRDQTTELESKRKMKKERGLPSPDKADILVMTFVPKVNRRDSALLVRNRRVQDGQSDYDPINYHQGVA